MKHLIYLLIITSFISLGVTNIAYSQEKKNEKKFLNLTAGLTFDEKLVFIPDEPTFKGDFKKVTKLSLSKESKTLRFEPTSEGIGTLTILDGRGRVVIEYVITVKKSRLENVAREIKNLLGEIEGISIKVINNKVVVDGEILLPRDMNRIMSVVSQYGEQASAIVTLSPIAQKKIAELIEKDINNPEITCRAVNGKFLLEGLANSPEDKARAYEIAQVYVPDYVVGAAEKSGDLKTQKAQPVINHIVVKAPGEAPPPKTIQLIVHYVELKKDYGKGFRFQFTPTLGGEGGEIQFQAGNRQPGGVISTISGTISNLLPKLNWAKEHGHARVLRSTSVIVQEKQTGKIQSVTQIPYPTIGPDGQSGTGFADAGITSDITPTIPNPNSDVVNLSVSFNISAPTGTIEGRPMISKNAIQTAVAVRSTQSAAIGGLISNNTTTGYNRMPKNTNNNPIISLYSSREFSKDQSQFVVFITPVIKNSASAGSEKIKAKFRLKD